METAQASSGDQVLLKALNFLRASGYTTAAAKLEKEFDTSADPQAPAHVRTAKGASDGNDDPRYFFVS
jgi:hypothetical protein